MREIKFRIWNQLGKNMLYDLENVYECLMQQIVFDKSAETRGFKTAYDHRSDGMVWMQFTGLLDKNGKEIYEGDIVKDLGYFERLTEEEANESGIALIKWADCGFIAHYKGIEIFSVEYIDKQDRFEIIGNIYENPELLK